jgi:hypothetical protein
MTLLTNWKSLREFSAMRERMNRESNSPEGPDDESSQ